MATSEKTMQFNLKPNLHPLIVQWVGVRCFSKCVCLLKTLPPVVNTCGNAKATHLFRKQCLKHELGHLKNINQQKTIYSKTGVCYLLTNMRHFLCVMLATT